jgi:hypothetical protein
MAISFDAYAGSGNVLLVWRSPEAIPGCLGYAVLRRTAGGASQPLLGYVGFSDGRPVAANGEGQPSSRWPFQRFTWTDFNPLAVGQVEYQVGRNN